MKKHENVKVEKMVVFVKTFDHYHRKFNFGNFFQTVKEFATEIQMEIYLWLYKSWLFTQCSLKSFIQF